MRRFAVALLTLSLGLCPLAAPAQEPPQDEPTQDQPNVLPEIVRLSYVEGDVRLQRGKVSGPSATGWVTAKGNVPLESGFSLVTGNGRAEIEFEDGSTAYVDGNSALTFNQLVTVNNAPQTAMTLLTGSMRLHLDASLRGERYVVFTPKHNLYIPYPERSYVRVDSYLDAMDVTPLSSLPVRAQKNGLTTMASEGQTLRYVVGSQPMVKPATAGTPGFDAWADQRIQERTVATESVMKDAGLTGPIPGIADLYQQGQFFPCQPYGTCWTPSAGWMGAHAAQLQGVRWEDEDDLFPCWTGRYRNLVATDPATQKRRVLYSRLEDTYNYDWAVCHAGFWLHREHHWVWVVGRRLHHRHPVRYVETGGHKGYVPVHPKDVKGRVPENLKHGLFTVADKKQGQIEHVAWDGHEPVKPLAGAPKEFRKEEQVALPSSPAPQLEAKVSMPQVLQAGVMHPQGGAAAGAPQKISFNARAQTFMLSGQQERGGHTMAVSQPLGARVDAATSHGGGGGAMAFAPSGAGSRGGGSASFSGGGGGSRSSGGGSSYSGGGGGGSHASTSSPASSAPAPSTSSSSAGSASHH